LPKTYRPGLPASWPGATSNGFRCTEMSLDGLARLTRPKYAFCHLGSSSRYRIHGLPRLWERADEDDLLIFKARAGLISLQQGHAAGEDTRQCFTLAER